MKSKPVMIIAVLTAIAVIVMIVLTAVLTPERLHPAYAVATEFMNAAGKGDDAVAMPLLSDEMQDYVRENCPDSSPSHCLADYIPEEWGGLIAAVYRRSIPVGDAFDVLLVATYEHDQGFSGVCIYHRMEQQEANDWRVTAWSGFVSCDLPNAGIEGLRLPDAPNRAPESVE